VTTGTGVNTMEIRQLTDVLQCKLHNHFQCNGKPSIQASEHLSAQKLRQLRKR
jgi:hypothetical protein